MHRRSSGPSSKREEEKLLTFLQLSVIYCTYVVLPMAILIAVTFVIGLGDRKDTFSGDTAVRKLVRDR